MKLSSCGLVYECVMSMMQGEVAYSAMMMVRCWHTPCSDEDRP